MLDENTATLLVNTKYEDKGIEGVIELIDTIPNHIKTFSPNCGDKAWVRFVGSMSAKLELLDELITTKKLGNQREDLKEIGEYLQKLGKEIVNCKFEEETHNTKDKPKDKVEEAVSNLFEVLFERGEK